MNAVSTSGECSHLNDPGALDPRDSKRARIQSSQRQSSVANPDEALSQFDSMSIAAQVKEISERFPPPQAVPSVRFKPSSDWLWNDHRRFQAFGSDWEKHGQSPYEAIHSMKMFIEDALSGAAINQTITKWGRDLFGDQLEEIDNRHTRLAMIGVKMIGVKRINHIQSLLRSLDAYNENDPNWTKWFNMSIEGEDLMDVDVPEEQGTSISQYHSGGGQKSDDPESNIPSLVVSLVVPPVASPCISEVRVGHSPLAKPRSLDEQSSTTFLSMEGQRLPSEIASLDAVIISGIRQTENQETIPSTINEAWWITDECPDAQSSAQLPPFTPSLSASTEKPDTITVLVASDHKAELPELPSAGFTAMNSHFVQDIAV